MLETEGEPYLATLDEEMSFFALHSLDVLAAYSGIAAATVYLAFQLANAAARGIFLDPAENKAKLL